MAKLIPWEQFEEEYAQKSRADMGAPAKSFRMALGALIIKEKLGITDRETVEQIKENPYLQYFIGLSAYRNQVPFDSSMLVHFKEKGIRMSGPPLGRPPASISKEKKKQANNDERIRNCIEGKFGQAKRRFSLNRIMAKLRNTSETAIAITFLVMNLSNLLRQVFCVYFWQKYFWEGFSLSPIIVGLISEKHPYISLLLKLLTYFSVTFSANPHYRFLGKWAFLIKY